MSRTKGFTLIEMMIAVVIVGILAMVAIPSYNQYVEDSAIADAQASLLGLASAMERHRAQSGTYEGAISEASDDNTCAILRDLADDRVFNIIERGLPNIYSDQSPETGTAFFRLDICIPKALADNPSSPRYVLTATATADAPGITENATITIASNGEKGGSAINAWQ